MSYHYITLDIVMRDCKSKDDAIAKLTDLLPKHPDENTVHMESWDIVNVVKSDEKVNS